MTRVARTCGRGASRRLAAALTLACVALTGCGGGRGVEATARRPAERAGNVPTTADAVTTPAGAEGPGPERRLAAAIISRVAVFAAPDDPKPAWLLRNPTRENYGLTFLVLDDRPAAGDWLHVSVPIRPNGTTGWIRAGDVVVSTLRARILVERAARRLRFWLDDRLVLDERVAVGTPATPTPLGHFFVDAVARPPSPRGPFGPYQVSVTGFSEVLRNFGGGQGQIAIHGTNRPELIGGDVSNGCIRLRNAAVTILAERVPTGTPVEIRA